MRILLLVGLTPFLYSQDPTPSGTTPEPQAMSYAQSPQLHIKTFAERANELMPDQTNAQVVTIMGGQPQDTRYRHKNDNGSATWYYASPPGEPFQSAAITFSKGKVKGIKLNWIGEQPSQGGLSKVERVLQVGALLYLTWACPQVRRKPLILLTANDLQLLQMCTATGF